MCIAYILSTQFSFPCVCLQYKVTFSVLQFHEQIFDSFFTFCYYNGRPQQRNEAECPPARTPCLQGRVVVRNGTSTGQKQSIQFFTKQQGPSSHSERRTARTDPWVICGCLQRNDGSMQRSLNVMYGSFSMRSNFGKQVYKL